MKRYSVFAIAREAMRYHSGWEKAWRAPEPKPAYDAIIVGAARRHTCVVTKHAWGIA